MIQVLSRERLPYIDDKVLGRGIEIERIPIKCVSSNVRRPDVPWEEMKLIPGIGREGNLVVVEVMTPDFCINSSPKSIGA